MRALCAWLFALLLVPTVARAAGYADLGTLERDAVDVALAARGFVIDPAPSGKLVGAIRVVNLDVFQPSDGRLLQWFNHFHRTTREEHIRRESLLLPGMPYDAALVDETMRNLRNRNSYSTNDPPLSSIVAMVPIQAATPGTVDALMVTRDVWSLRFNTNYNFELFALNLPTLSASLSENNLFGWRKQAAIAFIMDQGEMWLGPNYLDPNVLGSRLRLTAAFYEIWARKIGELAAGPREGSSSWLRLEYPFYALAQRWGSFVDGSYTTNVFRIISNNELTHFDSSSGAPTCASPGSAGDSGAACAYRLRYGGLTSGLTRSFPRSWLIQRVTVGNLFGLVRPSFLPDFPSDPLLRQSFAHTYFGPSDRFSALYAQYDAFTPTYRTYHNLDTFDLGEDQRLGPSLTLRFGRASTLLDSEQDFFLFKAEAHLDLGLLGGFQHLGVSWQGRDYSDGMRDELTKGQLYAATPVLWRRFRVVASAAAGFVTDNIHLDYVFVGGLEGLRGYPVNVFYGYDYYLAHMELRTLAVSLSSLRLGGLVFADAGHAANSVQGLDLYGDAGIGLRMLIPQLNAQVLRCDWAFPLRDYAPEGVRAGWPGRIFCGFSQATDFTNLFSVP
jgi:hypothetical protein